MRFLIYVLPLVFVLFFFGLMPPKPDLIIYTNNIVGEGTCTTYISSVNETFAHLYKANAYFGSELKTLRIPEIRYNVRTIYLTVYDVEEADICSFDISVFGIVITHVNAEGKTHPMTIDRRGATATQEGSLIHFAPKDPAAGSTAMFDGTGLIPLWLWICYFVFLLLISVLLSFALSVLVERVPAVRLPFLGMAAVLAALLAGAFFCGSLPYVDYTHFLLNAALLLAAALIVSGLTLPWIGPVAVSVFTLLWYIANFFVISFRGKPIMPADLKAVSTAMEVVNGYSLKPSWQMAVGILITALYCGAVILLCRRTKKKRKDRMLRKKLLMRGAAVAAGALIAVLCLNNSVVRSLNSFQWNENLIEGFHREGIVLTYVQAAKSSHVKRPDGYSKEAVDAYLEEYRSSASDASDLPRPVNIIMVMNEAFSDLRTVGLDSRVDVMPFIDSLKENTCEGSLYASVYAGGTCNTEFEALTGNSLAFFGTGAYPYTENVTSPMFSLASYFRDAGFVTEAFHANRAQNWNRNMVYPFLGFDVFHSIDDYPPFTEETYVHSHPADLADYLYIESVNDGYRGQKRFLFNVTMQNHSGYEHFEDLEEADTVKEYASGLPIESRVYLSLIRVSDKAVEQLVETYRDSDEPTMIIFFGDHQPGQPAEAQRELYSGASFRIDYFKTKFFIWTNYETEAVENESISANYLPWLILERGNFPLPPYIQMLKEVHEKYPIISSQGVIDAEGNVYDGVSELLEDPLIRKYRYVQYANVFDEIDPAWFQTN